MAQKKERPPRCWHTVTVKAVKFATITASILSETEVKNQ